MAIRGQAAVLIIGLSLATAAGSEDPAAVARLVAEAQRQAPWYWSSTMEGLAALPYTYEILIARPKAGKGELNRWRSLRLEKITLDFGSHQRCLAEDNKPCSQAWTRELDAQAERRSKLTVEDRTRIDETNRVKAVKRAEWWNTFAASHRFELRLPDTLRFRGEWNGELKFDPATKRIVRLRYEGFECETMTLPDGATVPRRIVARERATELSNFRRFTADVIIK
jgi:hypothetical protein